MRTSLRDAYLRPLSHVQAESYRQSLAPHAPHAPSLRWSRNKHHSKTGALDGRGHIAEMQSIHLRPPEVVDRLISGHWPR